MNQNNQEAVEAQTTDVHEEVNLNVLQVNLKNF